MKKLLTNREKKNERIPLIIYLYQILQSASSACKVKIPSQVFLFIIIIQTVTAAPSPTTGISCSMPAVLRSA